MTTNRDSRKARASIKDLPESKRAVAKEEARQIRGGKAAPEKKVGEK